MAKRFHDTEITEKDWWLMLSKDQKCLLDWITKKSDTAGIWDVNMVKFCMAYKMETAPDIDDFVKACNYGGKERMIKIKDGKKLFFTNTIHFQYRANGEKVTYMVEKVAAHVGVLNRLREHEETAAWMYQEIMKRELEIVDKKPGKSDRQVREELTPAMKENIKLKDNYTCQFSGKKLPPDQLHVEHIIPVSKGGENTMDNLVTMEAKLNTKKGKRDVMEFLSEENLDPQPRLLRCLKKLQKRGFLQGLGMGNGYGQGYGQGNDKDTTSSLGTFKKKKTKKEKSEFTFAEVMRIHNNPKDTRKNAYHIAAHT